MLVYWREVSVVVSMNSPKVPLQTCLLWNSDGRLTYQTMHFGYDIVKKSPPPIPDGSVKFLVSYLMHIAPQLVFIPFLFFSGDKLKLTRLLACPRFAVARVVDHACVVTRCQNSDWLPSMPIKLVHALVRMDDRLSIFF